MKTWRYELKKYFSKFNLIFLCVLLLLNIALTFLEHRSYFTADQKVIMETQDEFIALYQSDPDKYDEIYSANTKKTEAYFEELFSDYDHFPIYENTYIDLDSYGDRQLFNDVDTAISRQKNYQTKLNLLLRDTVTRLREVDENSYYYNYYVELCRYYTPLVEEELGSGMIRGWNDFFSQEITTILIAVAIASTLCTVFTQEKDVGMSKILRVTKYGKRHLRRDKLALVITVSATITLVFTLTPLIVLAISCGLSSLSEPVQSIDALVLCPFELTTGEFLAIYLILRVLFFVLFGMICAVTAQLFEGYKPSLVIAAALAVVGILIANIDSGSKFYFLAKFSPSSLADVLMLFERYRGLNFFGICLNYSIVAPIASLVIIAVLYIVSLNRESKKIQVFRKKAREETVIKNARPMPLVTAEYKKHIICGKCYIIILAAIILNVCVSFITFTPTTNYVERQYIKYISNVRGKVSEEKYDYVDEEYAYILRSIAEYPTASSEYRLGNITEEEFNGYEKRKNYANYCNNSCKMLLERANYLKSAEKKHPDVEFIYDEGLTRYFKIDSDIAAVGAIILIFSSVFAVEYESGFHMIMRTAKKGRKKVWLSKLIYTLSLATLIFILLHGYTFAVMLNSYEIDYLDAPVQSMPIFSGISENISVGTYLLLHELISYLGYLLTALVVSSLSVMLKKQLSAAVCSFMIIGIPHFIRMLGIVSVNIFDYFEMLTPQNAMGDILSRILCTAFALLLTVISYRKWTVK